MTSLKPSIPSNQKIQIEENCPLNDVESNMKKSKISYYLNSVNVWSFCMINSCKLFGWDLDKYKSDILKIHIQNIKQKVSSSVKNNEDNILEKNKSSTDTSGNCLTNILVDLVLEKLSHDDIINDNKILDRKSTMSKEYSYSVKSKNYNRVNNYLRFYKIALSEVKYLRNDYFLYSLPLSRTECDKNISKSSLAKQQLVNLAKFFVPSPIMTDSIRPIIQRMLIKSNIPPYFQRNDETYYDPCCKAVTNLIPMSQPSVNNYMKEVIIYILSNGIAQDVLKEKVNQMQQCH